MVPGTGLLTTSLGGAAISSSSHLPHHDSKGPTHSSMQSGPRLGALATRASWNANLPIHKLPAELLLEIFKYFIPRTTTLLPPSSSLFWIKLTGVCRLWHDLIHSATYFWRDIVVGESTSFLDIALPRARQAPVGLWVQRSASLGAITPRLQEHAGHVTQLSLPSMVPATQQRAYDDILEIPLPSLTTLSAGSYEFHVTCQLHDNFYPQLRRLWLRNFSLSWAPSLLANLRYLQLNDCLLHDPLPLSAILDVLEQGQHLEVLTLQGFLVNACQSGSVVGGERIVVLPKLKDLCVWEPVDCIDQFIKHVRLPEHGYINIIGTPHVDDMDGLSATYTSLLPHNRGEPSDVRFLKAAREAELTVWDELNTFTLGAYGSLEVRVSFESEDTQWDWWIDEGISQFAVLLSGASLVSLTLTGVLDRVALGTWNALLETFHGLQELTLQARPSAVYGHDYAFADFPDEALLSLGERRIGPGDGDGDGSELGISVRCPKLKRLVVSNWEYCPEAVDIVLANLQSRAQGSAERLEALSLDAKFEDAEEREEARARYSAALDALVDHFDHFC
ncbi:hypothetical protein C8Q79DRAFT_173156 [Trametes meyenii]|nr:hypothetical protein C8Q79DRAFT_173156 [Trametes meyenii]